MAETHPVRLSQSEVIERGKKFFGSDGYGFEITVDEPDCVRFDAGDQFVQLKPRPDGNNQVRLTIENKGLHEEIRQFRRMLSDQSTSETRQ